MDIDNTMMSQSTQQCDVDITVSDDLVENGSKTERSTVSKSTEDNKINTSKYIFLLVHRFYCRILCNKNEKIE